MRGVNFDYPEAGIARAPRRVGKSPNDLLNAIDRERLRRRIIIGKRNRARRHHVLPAALGFRNDSVTFPWVLHNPAVTAAIVGARNARQVEQNVGATELNLTDDDIAEIEGRKVREPKLVTRQHETNHGQLSQ